MIKTVGKHHDISREKAKWALQHDWAISADVVDSVCVWYKVTVWEAGFVRRNGATELTGKQVEFTSWEELRAWAGY